MGTVTGARLPSQAAAAAGRDTALLWRPARELAQLSVRHAAAFAPVLTRDGRRPGSCCAGHQDSPASLPSADAALCNGARLPCRGNPGSGEVAMGNRREDAATTSVTSPGPWAGRALSYST